ncbi:sugar phosphate isomerase/epimerase family protein [Alicyclobacillus shizuokensis]|uniref:sugar phosphate isomerase/epimerase family protein n=1 Tax=Alicyclobacillus shizuokensis TaxID=392014 RepID=UPI00082A7D05|nr:sugar phosphate isomerase/epimerase [Alicyclobacillus shizuokensis]MCL6626136.1 sugar phosphate isomerase/epimerase [Alicyclobacillus shizuokensis]
MQKGLTRAGVGAVGSLEAFIELAAAYGFTSIDAGGEELIGLVERHGQAGALALLREHGVSIGSMGLVVEWRRTEAEFRAGLPLLAQHAAAASALGCTRSCTYILPSTDENPAHFLAIATRRLRTCAEILGAYGMRLGLEFVGPHHLREVGRHPFIWDLQSTLDWIAAIGKDNVGLLLDAFHWYTTGATVDDIRNLHNQQIVHVHINDAKDVPVSQVRDNDRLFPGEGVINLVGFLQALADIGYDGPVAQEVLTPTPLTEDSHALAARSQAAFARLFSAAGL